MVNFLFVCIFPKTMILVTLKILLEKAASHDSIRLP